VQSRVAAHQPEAGHALGGGGDHLQREVAAGRGADEREVLGDVAEHPLRGLGQGRRRRRERQRLGDVGERVRLRAIQLVAAQQRGQQHQRQHHVSSIATVTERVAPKVGTSAECLPGPRRR
jgi:hypothetical protein